MSFVKKSEASSIKKDASVRQSHFELPPLPKHNDPLDMSKYSNTYYRDKRSMKPKRMKSESSMSHFKPDNSIENITKRISNQSRSKGVRFSQVNQTHVFEKGGTISKGTGRNNTFSNDF